MQPIPTGTKVIANPEGRVGVISRQVNSLYIVRFSDGSEQFFGNESLSIFKKVDSEIPGCPEPEALLPFVIFRCIVGSTAYGLNQEGSDIDRRGFYLPPADLHWGLAGVPEQIETHHEECYWELEKFLRLALKTNPNILECLYSPLVETCTPLAAELVAMRSVFLSRHAHRTYNSYVLSQFKKLEQHQRNKGEIRWKHVMHLIRLLLSGIHLLREGIVTLRMDTWRDQLLEIRRGCVPWCEVEAWRLRLHADLDAALVETTLPEHPNYLAANDFLLRARHFAATRELNVEHAK